MAGTDFGLPTSLLKNSPAPNTQPTPMLPVPPPPSFADFKFQLIGKQPGLLERFSESQAVHAYADDETMCTPSESEQHYSGQTNLPRARPSLWQVLAEPDSTIAVKPINDNLSGQSSVDSLCLPVVQATTASRSPVSNTTRSTSKEHPRQGDMPSTFSAPSTNSGTSFVVTISPHSDGRQDPNDSLDSMQLRYPSPSPGPSSAAEGPVAEAGRFHPPSSPSSPVTHKYGGLRQILTRLQSHLLNSNPPNLASANLLVESANIKAAAVLVEARRVYNFSQEAFNVAQKSLSAAKLILSAAEEVKGLAEGAKSELERISPTDVKQEHDLELREIFHSLNDWISKQEADEVASRTKQVQQVKARKRNVELARVMDASQRSVAPLDHPSDPQSQQTTRLPLDVTRIKSKQPLFFSPTPEVDIKADLQTWNQSPMSVTEGRIAGDVIERQVTLSRQFEEKRRPSAEAVLRDSSPSQSAQSDGGHREEVEKEKNRQTGEQQREGEQVWEGAIEQQETERGAREAQETRTREKVLNEASERRADERAEAEGKAQEAAEGAKKTQEEGRKSRGVEDEKQRMAAFLAQQKQEQEKAVRQAEEAKRRAREEEQAKEQRMLQEQARKKAERKREDELRLEQEVRRQQIQADKNRIMADRAQQIRAERENRLRTSLDVSIETSLDSSSRAPHISSVAPGPPMASNPLIAPSDLPPAALAVSEAASSVTLPPPALNLSLQTNGKHSSSDSDTANAAREHAPDPQLIRPNHSEQLGLPPTRTATPPPRNPSLPPVAHLSPDDYLASPPAQLPPPLSVHRHSDDTGNVPFAKDPVLSPQAQAANLRHVVSALQLPALKLSPVKMEPDQNDSSLLRKPIGEATPSQLPLSSQSQQPPQRVESQAVVAPPQVSVPTQPHPLYSHPDTSYIPSPPARDSVTDIRDYPQHMQKNRNQQHPPVKPMSGLNSQNQQQNSAETRNQSQLQLIPASASYSRSESPFRMGPDVYVPPSPVESDGGSGAREPLPLSRTRNETSAHPRWDHYSPSPSRSPPRSSNAYRPYLSRPSSPTVAGRKRSRDHSPPLVRDYRDYEERRPPLPRRRSRSPPPRRNRKLSSSRSPPAHQVRPPLAFRLTQGLGEDYNPPSAPRDSSRPELLNRFTDPRASNPPISTIPQQQPRLPPTRPSRGRVKRGRGGGGGSGGGPSHASLEKRISSGTALMHRLEDPPRS